MNPSIIVHHPIPEALEHVLTAAGYVETETTDRYSRFAAHAPEHTTSRPRTDVSPADSRMEKLLFTPEEAARCLSIGRTKLYELITAGTLASVRVGKCRRIPANALIDFVNLLHASDPGGIAEAGRTSAPDGR